MTSKHSSHHHKVSTSTLRIKSFQFMPSLFFIRLSEDKKRFAWSRGFIKGFEKEGNWVWHTGKELERHLGSSPIGRARGALLDNFEILEFPAFWGCRQCLSTNKKDKFFKQFNHDLIPISTTHISSQSYWDISDDLLWSTLLLQCIMGWLLFLACNKQRDLLISCRMWNMFFAWEDSSFT